MSSENQDYSNRAPGMDHGHMGAHPGQEARRNEWHQGPPRGYPGHPEHQNPLTHLEMMQGPSDVHHGHLHHRNLQEHRQMMQGPPGEFRGHPHQQHQQVHPQMLMQGPSEVNQENPMHRAPQIPVQMTPGPSGVNGGNPHAPPMMQGPRGDFRGHPHLQHQQVHQQMLMHGPPGVDRQNQQHQAQGNPHQAHPQMMLPPGAMRGHPQHPYPIPHAQMAHGHPGFPGVPPHGHPGMAQMPMGPHQMHEFHRLQHRDMRMIPVPPPNFQGRPHAFHAGQMHHQVHPMHPMMHQMQMMQMHQPQAVQPPPKPEPKRTRRRKADENGEAPPKQPRKNARKNNAEGQQQHQMPVPHPQIQMTEHMRQQEAMHQHRLAQYRYQQMQYEQQKLQQKNGHPEFLPQSHGATNPGSGQGQKELQNAHELQVPKNQHSEQQMNEYSLQALPLHDPALYPLGYQIPPNIDYMCKKKVCTEEVCPVHCDPKRKFNAEEVKRLAKIINDALPSPFEIGEDTTTSHVQPMSTGNSPPGLFNNMDFTSPDANAFCNGININDITLYRGVTDAFEYQPEEVGDIMSGMSPASYQLYLRNLGIETDEETEQRIFDVADVMQFLLDEVSKRAEQVLINPIVVHSSEVVSLPSEIAVPSLEKTPAENTDQLGWNNKLTEWFPEEFLNYDPTESNADATENAMSSNNSDDAMNSGRREVDEEEKESRKSDVVSAVEILVDEVAKLGEQTSNTPIASQAVDSSVKNVHFKWDAWTNLQALIDSSAKEDTQSTAAESDQTTEVPQKSSDASDTGRQDEEVDNDHMDDLLVEAAVEGEHVESGSKCDFVDNADEARSEYFDKQGIQHGLEDFVSNFVPESAENAEEEDSIVVDTDFVADYAHFEFDNLEEAEREKESQEDSQAFCQEIQPANMENFVSNSVPEAAEMDNSNDVEEEFAVDDNPQDEDECEKELRNDSPASSQDVDDVDEVQSEESDSEWDQAADELEMEFFKNGTNDGQNDSSEIQTDGKEIEEVQSDDVVSVDPSMTTDLFEEPSDVVLSDDSDNGHKEEELDNNIGEDLPVEDVVEDEHAESGSKCDSVGDADEVLSENGESESEEAEPFEDMNSDLDEEEEGMQNEVQLDSVVSVNSQMTTDVSDASDNGREEGELEHNPSTVEEVCDDAMSEENNDPADHGDSPMTTLLPGNPADEVVPDICDQDLEEGEIAEDLEEEQPVGQEECEGAVEYGEKQNSGSAPMETDSTEKPANDVLSDDNDNDLEEGELGEDREEDLIVANEDQEVAMEANNGAADIDHSLMTSILSEEPTEEAEDVTSNELCASPKSDNSPITTELSETPADEIWSDSNDPDLEEGEIDEDTEEDLSVAHANREEEVDSNETDSTGEPADEVLSVRMEEDHDEDVSKDLSVAQKDCEDATVADAEKEEKDELDSVDDENPLDTTDETGELADEVLSVRIEDNHQEDTSKDLSAAPKDCGDATSEEGQESADCVDSPKTTELTEKPTDDVFLNVSIEDLEEGELEVAHEECEKEAESGENYEAVGLEQLPMETDSPGKPADDGLVDISDDDLEEGELEENSEENVSVAHEECEKETESGENNDDVDYEHLPTETHSSGKPTDDGLVDISDDDSEEGETEEDNRESSPVADADEEEEVEREDEVVDENPLVATNEAGEPADDVLCDREEENHEEDITEDLQDAQEDCDDTVDCAESPKTTELTEEPADEVLMNASNNDSEDKNLDADPTEELSVAHEEDDVLANQDSEEKVSDNVEEEKEENQPQSPKCVSTDLSEEPADENMGAEVLAEELRDDSPVAQQDCENVSNEDLSESADRDDSSMATELSGEPIDETTMDAQNNLSEEKELNEDLRLDENEECEREAEHRTLCDAEDSSTEADLTEKSGDDALSHASDSDLVEGKLTEDQEDENPVGIESPLMTTDLAEEPANEIVNKLSEKPIAEAHVDASDNHSEQRDLEEDPIEELTVDREESDRDVESQANHNVENSPSATEDQEEDQEDTTTDGLVDVESLLVATDLAGESADDVLNNRMEESHDRDDSPENTKLSEKPIDEDFIDATSNDSNDPKKDLSVALEECEKEAEDEVNAEHLPLASGLPEELDHDAQSQAGDSNREEEGQEKDVGEDLSTANKDQDNQLTGELSDELMNAANDMEEKDLDANPKEDFPVAREECEDVVGKAPTIEKVSEVVNERKEENPPTVSSRHHQTNADDAEQRCKKDVEEKPAACLDSGVGMQRALKHHAELIDLTEEDDVEVVWSSVQQRGSSRRKQSEPRKTLIDESKESETLVKPEDTRAPRELSSSDTITTSSPTPALQDATETEPECQTPIPCPSNVVTKDNKPVSKEDVSASSKQTPTKDLAMIEENRKLSLLLWRNMVQLDPASTRKATNKREYAIRCAENTSTPSEDTNDSLSSFPLVWKPNLSLTPSGTINAPKNQAPSLPVVAPEPSVNHLLKNVKFERKNPPQEQPSSSSTNTRSIGIVTTSAQEKLNAILSAKISKLQPSKKITMEIMPMLRYDESIISSHLVVNSQYLRDIGFDKCVTLIEYYIRRLITTSDYINSLNANVDEYDILGVMPSRFFSDHVKLIRFFTNGCAAVLTQMYKNVHYRPRLTTGNNTEFKLVRAPGEQGEFEEFQQRKALYPIPQDFASSPEDIRHDYMVQLRSGTQPPLEECLFNANAPLCKFKNTYGFKEDQLSFFERDSSGKIRASPKQILSQHELTFLCRALYNFSVPSDFRGCMRYEELCGRMNAYLYAGYMTYSYAHLGFKACNEVALVLAECVFHMARERMFGKCERMDVRLRFLQNLVLRRGQFAEDGGSDEWERMAGVCTNAIAILRRALFDLDRDISLPCLKWYFMYISEPGRRWFSRPNEKTDFVPIVDEIMKFYAEKREKEAEEERKVSDRIAERYMDQCCGTHFSAAHIPHIVVDHTLRDWTKQDPDESDISFFPKWVQGRRILFVKRWTNTLHKHSFELWKRAVEEIVLLCEPRIRDNSNIQTALEKLLYYAYPLAEELNLVTAREPKKRLKPGPKPKNPLPAEPTVVASGMEQEPTKPAKPTPKQRKRNVQATTNKPIATEVESSSSSDAVVAPPVKRGRGRPKKQQNPVEPSPEVPDSETPVQKPNRKRRGPASSAPAKRARKSAPADVATPTPTPVSMDVHEPVTTTSSSQESSQPEPLEVEPVQEQTDGPTRRTRKKVVKEDYFPGRCRRANRVKVPVTEPTDESN